jgi:TonB family protein
MKNLALAHTFNSLIKNRIIMINKKPTNRYFAWKNLLVLPAILTAVYAFTTPEYHYVTQESEPLLIYESQALIQKNVKGIVLTEDGKPLGGVYIASTGSLGNIMSAYTGSDGRFALNNVQDNAFLVLNCRGYASVTVRADYKSEMTIKMSKDNSFVDSKYVSTPVEGTSQKPLTFLDGVISDQPTSELISKLGNEFGTVVVLKGKEATDKYGEAGKNGVEEVYSRKKATELGLKFPFRRISPDEYPTFQGQNFTTFNEWVIGKLRYPAEATSRGIHGRITVIFSVEADGSVSDVKLQGKADPLIADAVIKAVQSSPKWEPALKEDARVPFMHMVSLKFELPDKIVQDDVYVMSEKMPMYPGGDIELLKFISTNTRYPESAKAEKIEGRVIVRFIVNTTGNAEDASVLRGVHPLLDNEALRVISMLTGFEPGMQGGKPVNVWYMVPITFVLPDDAEKTIESLKFRSKDGKTPLIVLDGVISDIDVNLIDPKTIESISVLKDQPAIDKYGEKARDGVIEIKTKKKN